MAMSFASALHRQGGVSAFRPVTKRNAGGGRAPGSVVKIEVTKADEDRRFFAGWASVIEKNGKPVVDYQGDVIDADTLTEAAHGFMRHHRVGKRMHRGAADKLEFVESIVFTAEVQKALGIDLGRVGWWVAGYALDDATWQAIKASELRALSIGGIAERVPAAT